LLLAESASSRGELRSERGCAEALDRVVDPREGVIDGIRSETRTDPGFFLPPHTLEGYMAKKAAKKRKKAKTGNHYFYIKCNRDGLIVGAWSPDEDLLKATVQKKSDIKLKNTADGVAIDKITFQPEDDFGSCVWRKIGSAWKCI
jgi:hypothetical protein